MQVDSTWRKHRVVRVIMGNPRGRESGSERVNEMRCEPHLCLSYAVPLDFLIHRLLIRPDIERIFAWREKKLREIFAS